MNNNVDNQIQTIYIIFFAFCCYFTCTQKKTALLLLKIPPHIMVFSLLGHPSTVRC